MKLNNYCAHSVLAFVLLTISFSSFSKNITRQVIEQTTFDEKIAQACSGKCGNRGHSKITSVSIDAVDERYHKVVVKAYAKYHEHKSPPKVLGQPIGGGVGIKYTVDLKATGILDAETCILKVNKVDISGDKYNLAKDAKKEEGKNHHWENCQNFI
jgi:hypothetical protein